MNDQIARVNPDLYQQASGSMTPEQIAEYKRMGDDMYNTVDFETSTILTNEDTPMIDAIAYTSEALKSGLHPSFLTADELRIMEEYKGKEWYKAFGYDSL